MPPSIVQIEFFSSVCCSLLHAIGRGLLLMLCRPQARLGPHVSDDTCSVVLLRQFYVLQRDEGRIHGPFVVWGLHNISCSIHLLPSCQETWRLLGSLEHTASCLCIASIASITRVYLAVLCHCRVEFIWSRFRVRASCLDMHRFPFPLSVVST